MDGAKPPIALVRKIDSERLYQIRRRQQTNHGLDPQTDADLVYLLGILYPHPERCAECGALITPIITRLVNDEDCSRCHQPRAAAVLRPAILHRNPPGG